MYASRAWMNSHRNARARLDNDEISGCFYLHFSVRFTQKAVVQLLLQNGATINIIEERRMTQIHFGAVQNNGKLDDGRGTSSGRFCWVELLLSYNTDPKAGDLLKLSVIQERGANSPYDTEKIELGWICRAADVNSTTFRGKTVLYVSALLSHSVVNHEMKTEFLPASRL